jgi:hypothetical protein
MIDGDEIELTDEELRLQDEAKRRADEPPAPVPGAEGLPDEVRDGDLSEEEGIL